MKPNAASCWWQMWQKWEFTMRRAAAQRHIALWNENEMKNAWNNFLYLFFFSFSASSKWSIPRCCKWWSAHETRRESSCRSGEKSSYARFALLPTSLTVFMVTAKCWKAFYLRFHNLLSHSSSKTSEIRSIVLFKIECQCDSRSRTSARAPHISYSVVHT